MALEATPFDWCSFYALFWNDKGIKCKVNIPDTVLFRHGQLSAWWSTNKEGCIQRHTSQSTTLEAIRKRFLAVAQEDDANYSKFVAVSWLGSGKPQLLRVMAFNQLCELLSDRLESGRPDTAPEVETPAVLQAFIQPWQDLRYVTTYINSGTSVTCHTFQRKYSRRYTPMSAATAGQLDARDADIILSAGEDGDAKRAEIEAHQGVVEPSLKMQLRKLTAHLVKYIQRAHGLTLGSVVCEYVRDSVGKVYLVSVLRTEWTSNAAGHGAGSLSHAALQAPVTDLHDVPAPAPADAHTASSWAPSAAASAAAAQADEHVDEDHGGDGIDEDDGDDDFVPLPAKQQQQQRGGARPMSALAVPSTSSAVSGAPGNGGSEPVSPYPQQHPQRPFSSSYLTASTGSLSRTGTLERPTTARPASRSGAPQDAPLLSQQASALQQQRMPLAQYPGGQARLTGLSLSVSNTWPSQQHEAALAPGTPHATIPPGDGRAPSPGRARSAGLPPAPPVGGPLPPPPRTASARPASSPSPASSQILGPRARSPSPGAAPGGAPLGFGSSTHRVSHGAPDRPFSARGMPGVAPSEFPPVAGGPAPPLVGALTARGEHVNGGPRGAPLMVSTLQREVEHLRDQLVYQHELAEASAAKVRVLEREQHVVSTTFDNRQHELQHLLAVTREELAAVRADRDQWQQRCADAETRASAAESERARLQGALGTERETTLNALKEYQDRDAANKQRIEQLESEVTRMSTTLKMETTSNHALKRQLLEFSDIAERNKNVLRSADMDPSLTEVLGRTGHLLNGQQNPTGEQYAVQKILQHYHADLRSVFLFYCQLESGFADFWPPVMGFPHWMLFCRDSETSDPRAGARVRSNKDFKMLQPSQCEELYHRYARKDDNAARGTGGKQDNNVLTYESFLCCVLSAAAALRRPDVTFLSEAVREYILRYLSRARRVTPQGLGKGTLRSAVEGTRAAPGLLRTSGNGAAAGAGGAFGGGGAGLDGHHHLGGHDDGKQGCPCSGSGSAVVKTQKKKRAGSATGSTGSKAGGSRPSSATAAAAGNPARMLMDAGNSAVMKELALLSLSGPTTNRDVLRTGGGFALA